MRKLWFSVLILATLLCAPLQGRTRVHVCRYCEGGLAPQQTGQSLRQYAPDRHVDVQHVVIDVTPNFEKRTVRGQVTITFSPIAIPLKRLTLHAADLRISKVTGSSQVVSHDIAGDELRINFAKPIPGGKSSTVTIQYEAQPLRGLYFRTPAMGYKDGDTHLWTQGEPHEARHWFPSFDYPNERFTSEVICHVPPDMIAVSNGRLVSETLNKKTGLKAFRWLQEKPHVNYLIALVAGHFKKLEEKHGDLSLGFFTTPSQSDVAQNSFRDTLDCMRFFEKEIGVPYPWAKYDQAVVDDFNWGGMENTSLTILTDRTLFPNEMENARSSQNLVAHELAHQWFGDYITCQDWSQLWLNEGFATYYAHLYNEHKQGRDAFLYGLYRDAQRIIKNKDERRPIVYRQYEQPWQQFDHRAYQKGSWVLHMLRTQLGPKLFRQCVKTYVEKNALRSAVTEDLARAFQSQTGQSLQQFFDQWVYHARHPELTVSHAWDEDAKLVRVSVKQTQKTDDRVLTFQFPVKLRFVTEKGTITHTVVIKETKEDFHVKLPAKPNIVRFDADYGLLADVKYDKPPAMLYAQLKDANDVIGRLLAIEGLAKKQDYDTIQALQAAVRSDGFYGVRIEAAKALREIHTAGAFAALSGSLKQEDARVREAVVEEIAKWFEPRSADVLLGVIASEKNPDVAAAAVRGLGLYQNDATAKRLTALLTTTSYKNELASAAIAAMRIQDDPRFIEPLIKTLKEREALFPSRSFGQALETLARLSRKEQDDAKPFRDRVRRLLVKHVHHPKERVQIAAIEALGMLGDPKATAIVASFNVGPDDSRVKRAATAALELLKAANSTSVELKTLREEILELKKSNEKLTDVVETLESKFKAQQAD